MPELPEVETMVRGIRPHCEGRKILEVQQCDCPRKPITLAPEFTEFERRIQGQRIQEVTRLAKRIVIRLDSTDRIVIEPRMTGLMLVADPPTETHRRLLWMLEANDTDIDSFEFWDRRGLGTVRLLSVSEFAELTERLGPDALQMSIDDWLAIKRRTSRPVKVAMLDQTLVAGIGNLYASEILHRAAVSPKRACSKVTAAQWKLIGQHTLAVLKEAIQYEGSTLGDGTYRNALNKDGSYQNAHQVYAKEGEPCPRCKDKQKTIKRIVQTQRATFYCSSCQK
ncbi:MAG: bifunctional DNA-formamidopyrimidine glycosylase/DNA-(apurinic or apyrimidinic site) lyase [Fuerstiella sp.]